MLKARLGPRVCSKASTHLTPVAALGRSPPFSGPLLVVGIFLLLSFLLLLLGSPPPRLICQRLSPPLAPRQLLSAPRALHSSSWVGVGRRLYLNSWRPPDPGRRKGGGVLRFTSSSGSRGLWWRSRAVRIGLTSFPLSHPPSSPAPAFASGSSRGPPWGLGSTTKDRAYLLGRWWRRQAFGKVLTAAPPRARFPGSLKLTNGRRTQR